VRDWFRKARPGLEPATDWVVIARTGAAELDAAETAAELAFLAAR